MALSEDETEGKRTERYEVVFRSDGQRARCTLTETRWRELPAGSTWSAAREPGSALACHTLERI